MPTTRRHPGGRAASRFLRSHASATHAAKCWRTACSARAPIFTDWATPGAVERATRLGRHRVETKWAGHIKYDAAAELSVGECGESR